MDMVGMMKLYIIHEIMLLHDLLTEDKLKLALNKGATKNYLLATTEQKIIVVLNAADVVLRC